jgi:hypothetical protein
MVALLCTEEWLMGKLCFLAAALLATGSVSYSTLPQADGSSQKGRAAVEAEQEAPARFKLAGLRSGIQKERFSLMRDEKALTALLKEHNRFGEFNTKGIDFKKQTVIGYFAGSKPTGGYIVELIGIDRKKEGATVRIRLLKPGKGSMVTQAFTAPFVIEAVEKLPAKVVHTVTEEERAPR